MPNTETYINQNQELLHLEVSDICLTILHLTPWAFEASPHKRELKCDTKHQSQEADATFITSDGSQPYKPWRTLDTDNNKK